MPLLDRKLRRDLWSVRWRVAAMVLTIACGVAIWIGISQATGNLLQTQERMLDEHNAPDLELTFLPEDLINLPDIAGTPGVAAVEGRLVMPGTIELKDGSPLTALILFLPQPAPTQYRLDFLAGRPFRQGANEVVIDRALADYHGYSLGDEIVVQVGAQTYRQTVVGISLSPEFLVTSSNPDYVIAEVGTLGVVYADIGLVQDALGFGMVNDLLVRYAPQSDRAEVAQAVTERARRLQLEKVTPREDGYSYKSVRMDVTAFQVYSPAIVVTLLGLSLGMGTITFRRFIVERLGEFGVLRVLGFSTMRLIGAFVRIALILGGLGGVLGILFGLALGWGFAEVYAKAMHLPIVEHRIDGSTVLAGSALGAITALIAVMLASLPVLRWNIPRLFSGAATLMAGSGRRWARSALIEYTLRSLWRERGLGVASVVAMAGATAVAISYGIAMTSTFETVEHSFGSERWEYALDFAYPLYDDEASDLAAQGKGVEATEPYLRTAVDLRSGDRYVIGVAVGVAPDSQLRPQTVAEGRPVEARGEIVLSVDLARDLNAWPGSDVLVEKGDTARSLRVVGITNDIFLKTVTLTLTDLQAISQMGEKISGLYMTAAPETPAALMQRAETARVTDKTQLVDHFRREIRDMMGIVYITIGFSVATLLLFVSTLIHLGIAERRGEYAILRSLGLSAPRLRNMILLRVALQLLAAQVIAVPLGLLIASGLNERMGEAWFSVNTSASLTDFAGPMLAALLVAPIVTLSGVRAVMALNVPEWLRRRMV